MRGSARSRISVAFFRTVCRPEPRSSSTMQAGWSPAPARNTTRSPAALTEPKSVNGRSSGVSASLASSSTASLPSPTLGIGADDPIGPGECIGRGAELPQRHSELRLYRRQRPRRPRCELVAVEIPPAGAIGHEHDRCAVGRPFRLEDRFRHAARDRLRLADRAVLGDVGEIERGAVPRHVGMIPGEPQEPVSVRRQPRRRQKKSCPPASTRPGSPPSPRSHRDDRVDRLALPGVILAHADPSIATRIDHAVGVPPVRARARTAPV